MRSTRLPIAFCVLLDFPDHNDTDCEVFANRSLNEDNCFKCDIPGKYLFSGNAGPIMCLILWILTLIMGFVGIVANSVVIVVLKKRRRFTTFDSLLCILACLDLSNSVACIFSGTGLICYLENWDRGLFTLIYYHFSGLLVTFGKSASSYMTVLITFERYLAIASPVNSRVWFTLRRTRFMILGVFLLALTFNIPRISSIWIGVNEKGQNVPELADKKYIIFSTALEPIFYDTLKPVHYFDGFATFIILIICNVLLLFKISRYARRRKELISTRKSDIHAARMFVPVVIVLFICNIIPTSFYILLLFCRTSHRELYFGVLLSLALNSAANLTIYYCRGSSFREEVRGSLPKWLKPMFQRTSSVSVVELQTRRL